MSDVIKKNASLFTEVQMKGGYEEMSRINTALSEEGLDQDRIDLENYEKYIVESE